MYTPTYVTVYRKTGHNAAPFEKIFLHLQSCRHPDIELSKFYHRSLSRSHYNRPTRSFLSAWNNTFLRNRIDSTTHTHTLLHIGSKTSGGKHLYIFRLMVSAPPDFIGKRAEQLNNSTLF